MSFFSWMKKNTNIDYYRFTFGASQKPFKDKGMSFAGDSNSTETAFLQSVCWRSLGTRRNKA